MSDELPPMLKDGIVGVFPAVREVTGPASVSFHDGSEITDLEAVVFCTGYAQDFSIIRGPGPPYDQAFASDNFKQFREAKFRKDNDQYPRLYYGFLSERYPESLAVLGYLLTIHPASAFVQYDLVTMALASLWSGGYPLPCKEVMKREIDSNYESVVRTLNRGPMLAVGFRLDSKECYEWLNMVAGTDIFERLEGWTLKSWKFWWNNRKLYGLLMNGTNVPAIYRLFDSGRGRMVWSGAMRNIERINEQVEMLRISQNYNI
jgi:dimethylaniline monooxygenase (N-oxide forming)